MWFSVPGPRILMKRGPFSLPQGDSGTCRSPCSTICSMEWHNAEITQSENLGDCKRSPIHPDSDVADFPIGMGIAPHEALLPRGFSKPRAARAFSWGVLRAFQTSMSSTCRPRRSGNGWDLHLYPWLQGDLDAIPVVAIAERQAGPPRVP